MKLDYYSKILIGTVLLTLVGSVVEIITSVDANLTNHFWSIIPNFMVVALLSYYINHTIKRGLKLSFLVFLIFYGVGVFNISIEALIFNVTDKAETISGMINGFVISAVISPVLVALFGKWKGKGEKIEFQKRSIGQWIWRTIVGDISYLVFYIVSGMILLAVYPQLMDFYGDKLPAIGLIINTQFLRAFIFIIIAVFILKTLDLSLAKRAIFIGLIFSIFGGIAPLIAPNEFMPGYIRLGHAFEVGISNFLYGLVLGYLMGQKKIEE